MHEQEGSRQRGTAAVDDGATTADGVLTDLATASVCGSATSGRGSRSRRLWQWHAVIMAAMSSVGGIVGHGDCGDEGGTQRLRQRWHTEIAMTASLLLVGVGLRGRRPAGVRD
jgi:hypothetical protein